ncbi:MAG TPA: bifunctional hydroxymethylpyrimidine kinase/phosphomethylpyrimidine kinase, partial [Pyrinomonadaceae bacterium]|nr:bifunctional hydroxymethylpyrimidine kinase/phosphomethylpyrimidine kinase [Pyrinomonadaceae bacterium]
IIADIKTFTAFGCFATAAIASLTFQNTTGVFGAIHQTAESIREQVVPVLEDFEIAAVKTGMLPTREIIEETARLVLEFNLPNFVVDPVVRSTSGFDLIDDAALQSVIQKLFPLARVVTPNIPEAERITNFKIESFDDMKRAAETIFDLGARAVLVKSGHLVHEGKTRDLLFDGERFEVFTSDFIRTNATHGTGCTLAAGIAANLAHGKSLAEAIERAKDFVTKAIRTAPQIGRGHSPINHSIKVES